MCFQESESTVSILESLRESQRSMQGRPRGTTAYSLDRCIILNGKKKKTEFEEVQHVAEKCSLTSRVPFPCHLVLKD